MTFSTAFSVDPVRPAVTRIGRFYITRELGRGSIGTVYLGHDPIIDRDVAIKAFRNRLPVVERKQFEQQFINEARAAGRLAHPHIVTIYEASSEGDATYIAMEYLQGCELSKLLDEGHRFKPDDVASISWKIADALDHAHKNKVVHRDIKPANIFLVGEHQPKIVDFGIARAPNRLSGQPDQVDPPHTLFRHNVLGTPNYMSPEQALGKSVDVRTDIYSLGAVMYEMLTGHKPFQADSTDKLLQLIAYKAPTPPHEINPDIPRQLSDIVMKAMSKREGKRYQHAEEMMLAIKRYLMRKRRMHERLPKSILPSEAVSSDRPAIRSPLFWSGCCIAMAALIAGLIWLR
jgi:serine/threonine protein kinase